jgi:hypothetical protein
MEQEWTTASLTKNSTARHWYMLMLISSEESTYTRTTKNKTIIVPQVDLMQQDVGIAIKAERTKFTYVDVLLPETKKLNSVALVRERTMPTERPPPVGEVVPTSADRGCCVVSATDSHGR